MFFVIEAVLLKDDSYGKIDTVGEYNTYDEARSNALALAEHYAESGQQKVVVFGCIDNEGNAVYIGGSYIMPYVRDLYRNLPKNYPGKERLLHITDFKEKSTQYNPIPGFTESNYSFDPDGGQPKKYVGGSKGWIPFAYKSPFDY